eukprot:4030547-Prorocentrum_lima.AAC.1
MNPALASLHVGTGVAPWQHSGKDLPPGIRGVDILDPGWTEDHGTLPVLSPAGALEAGLDMD